MHSNNFSFKPHLEMAHQTWSALLTKEDFAIDATCGNGHDTVQLARLAHAVHAFDVQSEAIIKAKRQLQEHKLDNVIFYQRCHSSFPSEIAPCSIKLIVYNLGYLPGGDKSITTETSSTLESLNQALPLLKPGGMISVTCYPGHDEGQKEEENILAWAENLDPLLWRCSHHRWINRHRSPSLLLILKG